MPTSPRDAPFPEPSNDPRVEPKQGGLSSELLDAVLTVRDVADLKALLAEHPEIGTAEVEADLAELAAMPGYGATFERLIELFRNAPLDPEGAWATFASAMAEAEEAGAELERETAEINAASERRDYDRVIELVDGAIPRASAAGLGLGVAFLRERRALALLNRSSTSRDEDIEAAIADFHEALILSPPEQQATILMHASVAFVERVRGEPAENLEQAISLLRDALAQVELGDDPEMKALVRTNLAMALVRRERGSRIENLREAARLCRSALTFRSVERNPVDWTYSQLNYADVLELLARNGEVAEELAHQARMAILDEEQQIDERWLVGAAHHAIGRALLHATHPDPETLVDDALDDGVDHADLVENLQGALHHLEAAADLMVDCPEPLRPARVLADLSRAYEAVEDVEAAIEVGMQALSVLRPNVAPQLCVDVAGRVGHLRAERREWAEAADAYRAAIEAAV